MTANSLTVTNTKYGTSREWQTVDSGLLGDSWGNSCIPVYDFHAFRVDLQLPLTQHGHRIVVVVENTECQTFTVASGDGCAYTECELLLDETSLGKSWCNFRCPQTTNALVLLEKFARSRTNSKICEIGVLPMT